MYWTSWQKLYRGVLLLAHFASLKSVVAQDRLRLVLSLPVHVALRRELGPFTLRMKNGGELQMSGKTLLSDWATFCEIFIAEDYTADYANATVLDLGAHKGYFGAYALLHGARTVESFEPESNNFDALALAVESYRRYGYAWEARRIAVGASTGKRLLHISRESWTHSLLPASTDTRQGRTETQEVSLRPLSAMIGVASSTSMKLIVKMDIEGSECDTILGTDPSVWRLVDELMLEFHDWAPCSTNEIHKHLAVAGLVSQGSPIRAVQRYRRHQHHLSEPLDLAP